MPDGKYQGLTINDLAFEIARATTPAQSVDTIRDTLLRAANLSLVHPRLHARLLVTLHDRRNRAIARAQSGRYPTDHPLTKPLCVEARIFGRLARASCLGALAVRGTPCLDGNGYEADDETVVYRWAYLAWKRTLHDHWPVPPIWESTPRNQTRKRPRGRPVGSGIDDETLLNRMHDLLNAGEAASVRDAARAAITDIYPKWPSNKYEAALKRLDRKYKKRWLQHVS